MVFYLNTYASKQDVLQSLNYATYEGQRTNTADALNLLRTEVFNLANGDRQDVENYAIVVTDGNSNINERMTIPAAVQVGHIDGLVQDSSSSSALAMEILQSCTKSLMWWSCHDLGTLWASKGPLWGESTLTLTKGQQYGALVFILLAWISCRTNSRFAGDLRPHSAHIIAINDFVLLESQSPRDKRKLLHITSLSLGTVQGDCERVQRRTKRMFSPPRLGWRVSGSGWSLWGCPPTTWSWMASLVHRSTKMSTR